MLIFKTISTGFGLVLTASIIYATQKKVAEYCKDNPDLELNPQACRLGTMFASSIIVGGVINKVINTVFVTKLS